MSTTNDSRRRGGSIWPLQDHDFKKRKAPLRNRVAIYAQKIDGIQDGSEDVGHLEVDKEKTGDVTGATSYGVNDSREIPTWRLGPMPVRVLDTSKDGPAITPSGGDTTGSGPGGEITPGSRDPSDGPITPSGGLVRADGSVTRGGTVVSSQLGSTIPPGSQLPDPGATGNFPTTPSGAPTSDSKAGKGLKPDPDQDFSPRDGSPFIPIIDEKWINDDRFETLEQRPNDPFQVFPEGYCGIMTAATDDESQQVVFCPTDARLLAGNYGSPSMATRLHEIYQGAIDRELWAPLHSILQVCASVGGKYSLKGPPKNSIAIQIGKSGQGDCLGGLFRDGDAGLARATVRDMGPWSVGASTCKHQIGSSHGQKIRPMHMSTFALFESKNGEKDGPLDFGPLKYPGAKDYPYVCKVHLSWDAGMQYKGPRDDPTDTYKGVWRWHGSFIFATTTTPGGGTPIDSREPSDPPPPPDGGGPGTPGGDNGGGPNTGGGNGGGGPNTGGGGGGGGSGSPGGDNGGGPNTGGGTGGDGPLTGGSGHGPATGGSGFGGGLPGSTPDGAGPNTGGGSGGDGPHTPGGTPQGGGTGPTNGGGGGYGPYFPGSGYPGEPGYLPPGPKYGSGYAPFGPAAPGAQSSGQSALPPPATYSTDRGQAPETRQAAGASALMEERVTAYTHLELSLPVVVARAQVLSDGAPFHAYWENPNSAIAQQLTDQSPAVMRSFAYGNQGRTTDKTSLDMPYVYTQKPGASIYHGGTAAGGWAEAPPELDIRDVIAGPPYPVPTSTVFRAFANGARVGFGSPTVATGGVKGLSLGIEANGDLTLNIHQPDGTLNPDASVTVHKTGGVAANIELADNVNFGFGGVTGTTLGTNAADLLSIYDGVDIGVGLGAGTSLGKSAVAKVGLYGFKAVQSTGWSIGLGLGVNKTLSAVSTLADVLDYLATQQAAHIANGIVGA